MMVDRQTVPDSENRADGRRNDERSDESNPLAIGRKEARATLDHQIETLADVDTKASKVLRLNVALLSILLMGTSVLAKSPAYSVTEFLKPLSLVGVGSLLVSTAFAGLTYTSSEFQAGLGPEDLRTVLNGTYNEERFREDLVESYADWIEFNDGTSLRNEPLITFTVVWAVYAVTFLTLGVLDVFLGTVPGHVVLLTITGLFAFTLSADVPSQLSRWREAVEPEVKFRRKMLALTEHFSDTEDNE